MQQPTRMSEAEVAIRLAERFLRMPGAGQIANVAIDGAVIEMRGQNPFFDIASFLSANGWTLATQKGTRSWHGIYRRENQELHISSTSGAADVVLQLGNRRVVAECKGGPLVKKEGSPEYRILKEVLGQTLIWNALPGDLLIVAVPDTPRFRKIACDWQQRPLVMKTGIQIALVSPTGDVFAPDVLA
jgi:hypothetical protein